MNWNTIVLLLIMFIWLIYIFSENYTNDEEYIYTSIIPIGLPIVQDLNDNGMGLYHQDMIGISINLGKISDTYKYFFNKKLSGQITNARILTEDNIVLIELNPSDKSQNGELYLSNMDRKYIRNNQVRLICNVNNIVVSENLKRVKIRSKFHSEHNELGHETQI